jgi:Enoyl-CoA hydratase/isomerase
VEPFGLFWVRGRRGRPVRHRGSILPCPSGPGNSRALCYGSHVATPPVSSALIATVAPAEFDGDFVQLRDRLEAIAASPARAVVLAPDRWAAEIGPGDLRWLELYPLPTVAAFEGDLAGPALDIALACDIRVCGEGASIGARHIGRRRLLTLIGHARSADLFGRRGTLDAEGLLQYGLVSDVTAAGSALAEAERIAGVIASRGPIATRLGKEAIWRGLELPFDHALRFETDLTLLLQTTKDRAEGVRAFLEKRPPRFTGE